METNTSSIQTEMAEVLAPLRSVLARLEPNDIPLPEVAGIWQLFSQVRRLAGNGETLLAGRVAEAREWSRSGYATPEEWMAAKAGTSVGEARGQIATSEQLGQGLDETAERMRQGRLSPQQAGIVADAAAVNPDAELELCDRAEHDSNKNLSDEARRRKAQRSDGDDRARRHHRERRARRYSDADDKSHLHVEGPTSKLAEFFKALDRETDRRYREATKQGRREGRDAYAFDAFLSLVTQGIAGDAATSSKPKHLAMIRVDLDALVRGHVEGEETCEIAGFGAISIAEARALLSESILYLVCTKGVDVVNLTHLGRGPNRVQELALLWASQTCQVAGCYRTHTQYDHRIDFAETQHTRVDETDLLCVHHHKMKTFKGYALVAGTGKRRFVPPGDPDHPATSGSGPGSPRSGGPPPGPAQPPPPEPSQEPPPPSESIEERIGRLRASAQARRRRAAGQGDLFGLAE